MQQREFLARNVVPTPHLRLEGRIWRCTCVFMCLFILADSLYVDSENPLINTKWGFVRGAWSRTARDRLIANFLGIPYALPPVGNLRFRSPQEWNRTWTTIRDATVNGQKCVQLNGKEVIGSEDCLYLNVFVPYIFRNRQQTLPILVFVHGGEYNLGSSDSKLYAPDYLLDQDVILVTLNYRLTALGFFSTANQVSPGNYGLKDIKMALEWIQENIRSFKGNPKSVTVMGHNAGSAATHILALSKKTEGLFHRYILHSGSALNSCSFHPRRRYRQVCLQLAKLVGCLPKKADDMITMNDTTVKSLDEGNVRRNNVYDMDYNVKDDEAIMRCMRSVDAGGIVKMTQYFASVWRNNPRCNFGPTLEDDSEDAILTMHPLKIIKDGLFRDIPAIIQVVKDEGLMKTLELYTSPDAENELIQKYEEYLPYFLEYHEVVSNTSIFTSAIQDFYFNGNVTLGLAHNVTEMTGDALVVWPMFQTLQYQSKIGNSSIYFAFFAYEGTFTFTFVTGIPIHYGITHGDDINYLFPILNNMYPDLLLHNTENDIAMINIMTEMWTSFATEGVPKALMIPAWPNYRDHHKYIRFGIDRSSDIVVQADFLSDRMEFWEKLMRKVSAESVERDIPPLVDEPQEGVDVNNADTIDRRLTVFLALIIIITIIIIIIIIAIFIKCIKQKHISVFC